MSASTSPSAVPASPPRWSGSGLAVVAVVAVAQLVIALDATVLSVALPSAQRELAFGDGARAWVITAYTVALAGGLLLGGRLVDVLGRRRALLAGLSGFAAASVLAAAAPGFELLAAGRAAQGAAGALMIPAALSVLAVSFTDPRERARAFGVYGAVASSGGVAGLLLGGVLTEYAGWRWCLYVVGAAGVLAAGAASRVVRPIRP